MRKQWRSVCSQFCFLLFLVGLLLAASSNALAISLPAGFSSELFVGGLNYPTTIAFAPDGRLFIGQKDGRVRVFQNGILLAADFVNISGEVNDSYDRGLLGIAVHPNFPNQPYIYLLYTYDPPGTVANGDGARVARLQRVTADAATNYNTAVANSTVILLGTNSVLANIGNPNIRNGIPSCENINGYVGYVPDCLPADSDTHTIGTVAFGLDGSLFVSNGDGAEAGGVDKRALRTLDVGSLSGKILRIDPLTGQGYADNPFYNGDPTSNQSKVYSLGLRNPFRFTVSPYNGEPYIGDVGYNTWEEINTGRGENFGWPCYEGDNTGSALQPAYANNSTTSARCTQLYSPGSGAVQAPLHAYNHNGMGASVQAGAFYSGSAYPAQYQGVLFFEDYNNDWIKYLVVTPSQNTDFPTTAVLDTFDRANTGPPPSANWVNELGSGFKVVNNVVVPNTYGAKQDHGSTWNTPFGADQEAYFTFKSFPTTGNGGETCVMLRLQTANSSTANRYEVCAFYSPAGNDTVQVWKQVNTNWTKTYSRSIGRDFTAGDIFGASIIGSVIKIYLNGSVVASTAAPDITGSGYIGIASYHLSSGTYDDFGGGNVTSVSGTVSYDFAFDVSSGGPVQLVVGPDSNLYYVALVYGTNSSEVRRIRYLSGTNTPPIAKASATPTSGLPPLTVNFSSAGSSDPDGDPITYSWNFGDGGTSTQANPSYTYGSTGTFIAVLTVADSKGATGTAQVTITAGNSKPTATILSPADGSKFTVGNTIVFQGRGTDPEQGTLTGASLVWNVLLHHNEHIHLDYYLNYYGETGSFVVIDHGDNTWLELCLAVTDNGGLTDTKCIKLLPNGTTLTFNTSPGGLQIIYDGVSRSAPFSVTVPVNAAREVIAPLTQGNKTFISWSDGGAATHFIVVGTQPATYTATYTNTGFPTTAVLDNFNRANTGPPPSANWVNELGSGFKVVNTVVVPDTYGNKQDHGSTWNTPFGADQEAYFTFKSFPTTGNGGETCVMLRLQTANSSTANRYEVCAFYSPAGNDTVQIWKQVNANWTKTYERSIGRDFTAGDIFGASIIGSVIKIYLNGSVVASTAAPDITGSGYIGIASYHLSSGTYDDFGGGNATSF